MATVMGERCTPRAATTTPLFQPSLRPPHTNLRVAMIIAAASLALSAWVARGGGGRFRGEKKKEIVGATNAAAPAEYHERDHDAAVSPSRVWRFKFPKKRGGDNDGSRRTSLIRAALFAPDMSPHERRRRASGMDSAAARSNEPHITVNVTRNGLVLTFEAHTDLPASTRAAAWYALRDTALGRRPWVLTDLVSAKVESVHATHQVMIQEARWKWGIARGSNIMRLAVSANDEDNVVRFDMLPPLVAQTSSGADSVLATYDGTMSVCQSATEATHVRMGMTGRARVRDEGFAGRVAAAVMVGAMRCQLTTTISDLRREVMRPSDARTTTTITTTATATAKVHSIAS